MSESGKSHSAVSELSGTFGDLPNIISRMWAAVASPLVELAITMVVLSFVLALDRQAGGSLSSQSSLIPSEALQRSLDFYGLKLVIPIAFLIVLLGVAQANSTLMRVLGIVVSVRFEFKSKYLLARYADRRELGEIWKYHLNLGTDFDALDMLIDSEVSRAQDPEPNRHMLKSASLLRASSDTLDGQMLFAKGLLVCAVMAAVVSTLLFHRTFEWARLLALLTAMIVLFVLFTIRRIRLERLYAYRKVKRYKNFLKASDRPAGAPSQQQSDAFYNQLEILRAQENVSGAWTLSVFPDYFRGDFRQFRKALWGPSA